MIPIYEADDGNYEIIEIVIDLAADGRELAFRKAELAQWFKDGFELVTVVHANSKKHFYLEKKSKKTKNLIRHEKEKC